MNKSFNEFTHFFGLESQTTCEAENVSNFIKIFSGQEFGQGIFRVVEKDDIEKWHDVVLEMFSDFQETFLLFGYDWLGRFFATNEIENAVFLFDSSTNNILTLEIDFSSFVNKMLPKHAKDILDLNVYKKWIKKNNPPQYSNCIGYKIPLFLGGKDSIHNFEECDMEVYWSISAQIISQIKNKADGTVIDSFSIE